MRRVALTAAAVMALAGGVAGAEFRPPIQRGPGIKNRAPKGWSPAYVRSLAGRASQFRRQKG